MQALNVIFILSFIVELDNTSLCGMPYMHFFISLDCNWSLSDIS